MFKIGPHQRLADARKIDRVGGKADFPARTKPMYMLGSVHPRSVLVAGMTIVAPQEPPVAVLHVEAVLVNHQCGIEVQPGANDQPRGDQRAVYIDHNSVVVVGHLDCEVTRQRVRPPPDLVDGCIDVLGPAEQPLSRPERPTAGVPVAQPAGG